MIAQPAHFVDIDQLFMWRIAGRTGHNTIVNNESVIVYTETEKLKDAMQAATLRRPGFYPSAAQLLRRPGEPHPVKMLVRFGLLDHTAPVA